MSSVIPLDRGAGQIKASLIQELRKQFKPTPEFQAVMTMHNGNWSSTIWVNGSGDATSYSLDEIVALVGASGYETDDGFMNVEGHLNGVKVDIRIRPSREVEPQTVVGCY